MVFFILMVVASTILAPRATLFVSIEQETAAGIHVSNHIRRWYKASTDTRAQAALQEMVERLVPTHSRYRYQIHLLDAPTPSAFAAPGGQIIVFTGLLDQAEGPEVVAGVLAHEIAHVENRHGVKVLLRSAGVPRFTSAAIRGGFESLGVIESLSEMRSVHLLFAYSAKMETEAETFTIETLQKQQIPVVDVSSFLHETNRMQPELSKNPDGWDAR